MALRDQIADALLNADAWAQLERRDDRDRFADAVMAVVQPDLDERDRRIAHQWRMINTERGNVWDLNRELDAERQRAERAEAERDRLRALVVRMAGATLAMQTHGRTSGNATLVGFAQRLREMLPDIRPDGSTTWPSMAYPVCTNCGAPTLAQNALCQPCRWDAPDQPETADE
jgi:hypothetical protein